MTDETKFPPEKNLPAGYVPPKVWTWDQESGGTFASINRPIAGSTHDKELPVGKHPHQLYSLGTPNGVNHAGFTRAFCRSGSDCITPGPGTIAAPSCY